MRFNVGFLFAALFGLNGCTTTPSATESTTTSPQTAANAGLGNFCGHFFELPTGAVIKEVWRGSWMVPGNTNSSLCHVLIVYDSDAGNERRASYIHGTNRRIFRTGQLDTILYRRNDYGELNFRMGTARYYARNEDGTRIARYFSGGRLDSEATMRLDP